MIIVTKLAEIGVECEARDANCNVAVVSHGMNA
jgi:hypothetical protein